MKEVVPPYPSDVKEAPLTLLEKPLQIAVNTPVTISGLTSETRYEAVDGTVQVTAQTVQLNLWLDSAEDAEITTTEVSYLGPIS